jgi:hypothetical protein
MPRPPIEPGGSTINHHHAAYLEDVLETIEEANPGWRSLPPGWTSGHGLAACRTCGRATSVRDSLGFGRHVLGSCPGELPPGRRGLLPTDPDG